MRSASPPASVDLTIRALDPSIAEQLRACAARHGHSVEEEARRILGEALTEAQARDGFDRLRRHFAGTGGVDLDLPARRAGREPPHFE